MWLKVRKFADAYYLDELLAAYRVRKGSISHQGKWSLVKYHYKLYRIGDNRNPISAFFCMIWLQGLYVYQAIINAAPVLHAFAKPGTKPIPYLDKPIPLTEQEAKQREEAERIARYEKMRAIMFSKAQQALKKKQ